MAPTLEDIADDVLYLIFSELSRSAVLTLSETSQAMHQATAPILYKHLDLKIGPNDNEVDQAYKVTLEKFRNDQNLDIGKHVRSISVKDALPTDDLMMILQKISQYDRLHSLNWETSAHMPASVLDLLEKRCPNLDLTVTVHDRPHAKDAAHSRMDIKLLSSPLLKTLNYTVYQKSYNIEQAQPSEWPQLTKALVDGGNVVTLKLLGKQDEGGSYSRAGHQCLSGSEPELPVHLNISSEARLPALRNLSINMPSYWGTSKYPWNRMHCKSFLNAIDPSQLRSLDFSQDNPEDFFDIFVGALPNLKSLKFRAVDSVESAAKFIESIPALESLEIDKAKAGIQTLWPAILHHKKTLKHLVLKPTTGPWCSTDYMDFALFQRVVSEFPALEWLGWDIPMQGKVVRQQLKQMFARAKNKFQIDSQYLSALSQIKLRRFDMFLHIPDQATTFSDKMVQNAMGTIAPPALNQEACRKEAVSMMKKISKAQDSPLECFTFRFTRTGYEDRAQPYLMYGNLQVRQSESNLKELGTEYEFRGGVKWSWAMALEEDVEAMNQWA